MGQWAYCKILSYVNFPTLWGKASCTAGKKGELSPYKGSLQHNNKPHYITEYIPQVNCTSPHSIIVKYFFCAKFDSFQLNVSGNKVEEF